MTKGKIGGRTLGNLEIAITILATNPNSIKERLKAAYWSELYHLMDEDFPKFLKKDWNDIKKELTGKGKEKYDEHSVTTALDDTLHRKWDKSCSKIAYMIVNLRDSLESYLNED